MTALLLGIGLAVSSHPVAASLTMIISALISRNRPRRALFTTLAVGLLLQVPWIVLALVAGVAWALLSTASRPRPSPVRAVSRARGVLAGTVLGLLAGGAGAGLVWLQSVSSPLALPFEKPGLLVAIPAIVALAAMNAVGEELIWRGAVDATLRSLPVSAQYAVQAGSFGLAHWVGLPSGLVGVAATACFSLLATYLRRRLGLRSSVSAHFVADLLLFLTAYTLSGSLYVSVGR